LAVRKIGRGVGGVELLHDAQILLRNVDRPLLFDVGANVGQTTLAMLDHFRSPRIHAFEPSPATCQLLQRAVGARAGVTVVPSALGEHEGVQPFHVTKDYSVNDSLLVPAWQGEDSVVDVRVETVMGYCARGTIERIDLLKIDAQGYDLHVLRGARTMLDEKRITLVACEVNQTHLYEGQPTIRDVLAFADDVGYELVGFYEQTYVADALSYFDILFRVRPGS
jgi:FkbM family methyltransferase